MWNERQPQVMQRGGMEVWQVNKSDRFRQSVSPLWTAQTEASTQTKCKCKGSFESCILCCFSSPEFSSTSSSLSGSYGSHHSGDPVSVDYPSSDCFLLSSLSVLPLIDVKHLGLHFLCERCYTNKILFDLNNLCVDSPNFKINSTDEQVPQKRTVTNIGCCY